MDIQPNNKIQKNNSEIVTSVENGMMVFKKPKYSDDEILFYNVDYFARIGYPEAEVSIGKMSEDGIMKGGYYENPEKLTYPFRQFAFFVQGSDSAYNSNEVESNHAPNATLNYNSFSNMLDGVRNNGNELSIRFNSIINGIGSYFNNASSKFEFNKMEEPKLEQTANPEMSQQNQETRVMNNSYYWIVKIPIKKQENLIPLGKYEKTELKLNEKIKEKRVELSLKMSAEKEWYEVSDGRYIGMCVRVLEKRDEYDEEVEGEELEGSIMSKWGKKVVKIKLNNT